MQNLDSQNKEILKFPADHEFIAMGPADQAFEQLVIDTVAQFAPVDLAQVRHRVSAQGNYWSVNVTAHIEARPQLLSVYAALKALPSVKWTL